MGAVRGLIIGGIVGAVLALGGCATAGAKAPPEPPSLDVPAPPPRVVVPPVDPGPALEVQETPVPDPAPTKKPQKPAPSSKPDPRAAQKTEPPPPPPVVETVRPVAPPASTLQQTPPGQVNEVERQVRQQLGKANGDLERVNYKALNADGRSQYDTAKRFIKEAEQALEEKNFVFALKVAEKAAGLAASLLGR